MPFALLFFRRFFRQLSVKGELMLSFRLFSRQPVCLGQSIVRLLQLGTDGDRSLVLRDSVGEILQVGVEDAERETRRTEFRIEADSFLQRRLHLGSSRRVRRGVPPPPKTSRVVII